MPRRRAPTATAASDLRVTGQLPVALSGQYVQVDGGLIRAVTLEAGRATAYRQRTVVTDHVVPSYLIEFGGALLLLVDGELASTVSVDLDTSCGVDLAGRRRGLVAHARVDAQTGELHLLTRAAPPSQLHVTVSRGGLTRTVRAIDPAPAPIRQLELTADDVVLLADGFVGLAPRRGANPTPTWFEVDTREHGLATARTFGDTVVVETTGRTLSRWTLDRQAGTARVDVIDRAPRGIPGAMVFVAGSGRGSTDGCGWFIRLVTESAAAPPRLVVVDATAIDAAPTAAVSARRRIATGGSGIWMPRRAAARSEGPRPMRSPRP